MADLQVTQVRSLIGATRRQRSTLSSLGLRRIRATVTVADRPEIRGMISRVAHLVEVAYPADGEVLDLQPGQRPKGEGVPPAGPSVSADEAERAAAEREEALADPGRVESSGDVVQRTPATGATGRPDRPKPVGSAVDGSVGPGRTAVTQDADTDEPDTDDTTHEMEIVDPEIVPGSEE